MASLVSMVNGVLDNLENLRVDPSKCVKARSPLSKCNACFDICPVKGVKWTGRQVEITECINCGLCASVCPSGGIIQKDFEPHKVIEKLEHSLSRFDQIYLYCSKHAPENSIEQGIEIPCLGILKWQSWLRLILNHKVKVYHSFDNCDSCPVKGGKELFQGELTIAETLCDEKISFISRLTSDEIKTEELGINYERRRFLGSILKSFVKIPEKIASSVVEFEEDGSKLPDKKLNIKHKILMDAIVERPELKDKINLDFPQIKEGCQFCGVCSRLCPQEALEQENCNGKHRITLNKSRCNGCRLCVDICFHKAIELEPSNLGKLEEPVSVVAEGSEFICSSCGIPYRATVEDKCPSCKKQSFN